MATEKICYEISSKFLIFLLFSIKVNIFLKFLPFSDNSGRLINYRPGGSGTVLDYSQHSVRYPTCKFLIRRSIFADFPASRIRIGGSWKIFVFFSVQCYHGYVPLKSGITNFMQKLPSIFHPEKLPYVGTKQCWKLRIGLSGKYSFFAIFLNIVVEPELFITVPVLTFEKLWFRFRFQLLKRYGSGSYFWKSYGSGSSFKTRT